MIQRANEAFGQAVQAAKRSGLIDRAALSHGVGAWWVTLTRRDVPSITSGFRSLDRQGELLDRWESGDRAGLISRPACRSWHTVGRAWDVDRDAPAFEFYRLVVGNLSGVRDGSSFGDRGHFDIPGPRRPPSICESV